MAQTNAIDDASRREYWDTHVLLALLQAQVYAVRAQEYYGPAIERCPMQATRSLSTFAINQKGRIMYNPDFAKSMMFVKDAQGARLDPKKAICLLVHEIMHVLYCHHKRQMMHRLYKILSNEGFNIAMDAEINNKIQHDFEYIRNNGITPQLMKWPPEKRMEDYAEMLYADMQNQKQKYPDRYKDLDSQQPNPQDPPQASQPGSGHAEQQPGPQGPDTGGGQSQGSGQGPQGPGGGGSAAGGSGPGIPMQNDAPPDPDKPGPDGLTPKEHIIDQLLRQQQIQELFDRIDTSDATQADMTGEKLANECARKHEERSRTQGDKHDFASDMVAVPKIIYPWQQVIKNIICDTYERKCWGFDHQTYYKCNRRMASVSKDILFPAWYGEEVSFNLVIAVDISGSMGDLIEEMYSRIKSLIDVISEQSKVTILEVDTEICRVVEDFDFSAERIETGAGGGTDMGCVPVWVRDQVKDHGREIPDLIVIMTDNYTGWDPVIPELKPKIAVLTNNPSEGCPYQQHEVKI